MVLPNIPRLPRAPAPVQFARLPNLINLDKRLRLRFLRYMLFSPLYLKRDVEAKLQKEMEEWKQTELQKLKNLYEYEKQRASHYESVLKSLQNSGLVKVDENAFLSALKELKESVSADPDKALALSEYYAGMLKGYYQEKLQKGELTPEEYANKVAVVDKIYRDIANTVDQMIKEAAQAQAAQATGGGGGSSRLGGSGGGGISVSHGGGGSRRTTGGASSGGSVVIEVRGGGTTRGVSVPRDYGLPAEKSTEEFYESAYRSGFMSEEEKRSYERVKKGTATAEDIVRMGNVAARVGQRVSETEGKRSQSGGGGGGNPWDAIGSFFSNISKFFGWG